MRASPSRAYAPVVEVFSSFQGEGLYVGEAQTFLRLAGCPLRCRWCDTPGSWAIRPDAKARIQRDGEAVERVDRIATPFKAALWIASVEPGDPRTVSVTGGEPLIWPDFILALKGMLGSRRLHLETAGAHPEALARVLEAVDHVSMDLKLPADMDPPEEVEPHVAKGGGQDGEEGANLQPIAEPAPRTRDDWVLVRRRSLELIQEHDACVKIVVSAGHRPRAYDELLEDVARRAPRCPVFLAPATPMGGVEPPLFRDLVEVVENARDLNLDVRVLPQVHRMLGIA